MIRVEEERLPDGRSYTIGGIDSERVTLIIRESGDREMIFYPKNSDTPDASVELDDDDARRLGAVLSGTYFRPSIPISFRTKLRDLAVDWVRIDDDSPAVGETIRSIDLHNVTGMTVIAIIRSGDSLRAPLADIPLQSGDRVVVVGRLKHMRVVQDVLTGA